MNAEQNFRWLLCIMYLTVGGVLSQPGSINKEGPPLICLFLFFGAVGKSAQLGLHT